MTKIICKIGVGVAVLATLAALKCFEVGALGWAETLFTMLVTVGLGASLGIIWRAAAEEERRAQAAAKRSAWKHAFFAEIDRL